jgi:hypothetical protein
MKINIPFLDEFHDVLIDGEKVCTTRTKKLAEPQDTFWIDGWEFQVDGIYLVPLEMVANFLWNREGCKSTNDFISIWCRIHPRVGYNGRKKVYLHTFHRTFSQWATSQT